MTEREPTCIGHVRHVKGAIVTVELDAALAGVAPIWRGRLVPVGQVGALVRIPQGPVNLIASVVLVGISDPAQPPAPTQTPTQGNRWLQVQLLGEVDGLGKFHRGVSAYPGLDDPVHFATRHELTAIYPSADEDHISIGLLSSAPDLPLCLNAAKLVTRHAAVVGSTGSGKTSAVASMLKSFAIGGWDSANIVVVDPHGEYSAALATEASTRSVLDQDDPLRVPFWALPAIDILRILCATESKTVADRFAELVQDERRAFAEASDWLELESASITADTPVPFNLRRVWHELDFENRQTVTSKTDGEPCIETRGDIATLTPTKFTRYEQGNVAPFKATTYGHYTPVPERLRLRLLDRRFRFFLEEPDPADPDPLPDIVSDWLGVDKPISVLDFSGVPRDVADVAIGVVLQLLFELATRGTRNDGIGRHRPVLVVLEEAHRYLGPQSKAELAQQAANQIAREGRKYGIGLMIVTQRPSELPETALAQVGTIVALRLTNGSDQAIVRSALPDEVSGLSNILPSLRTGEAMISGESVALPTRVLLRRPSPPPRAGDPVLDSWRSAPGMPNDVKASVKRWRSGTVDRGAS